MAYPLPTDRPTERPTIHPSIHHEGDIQDVGFLQIGPYFESSNIAKKKKESQTGKTFGEKRKAPHATHKNHTEKRVANYNCNFEHVNLYSGQCVLWDSVGPCGYVFVNYSQMFGHWCSSSLCHKSSICSTLAVAIFTTGLGNSISVASSCPLTLSASGKSFLSLGVRYLRHYTLFTITKCAQWIQKGKKGHASLYWITFTSLLLPAVHRTLPSTQN